VGVSYFSTKWWGRGSFFRTWKKERFKENSVKSPVLTTSGATKAQKHLKTAIMGCFKKGCDFLVGFF
jgi:hypothetical protein